MKLNGEPSCLNFPKKPKKSKRLREKIAQDLIALGAAQRDLSHEFPADIVKEMADQGFLGMFIPEEYNGGGYKILDYVVALEEICYADAGVGVIMSVNNSLVCWPIFKFSNEEQKQKYLAPLAAGKKLGCYALTEPEAGSDAAAQRTKMEKQRMDISSTVVKCGSRMVRKLIFVSPMPTETITLW